MTTAHKVAIITLANGQTTIVDFTELRLQRVQFGGMVFRHDEIQAIEIKDPTTEDEQEPTIHALLIAIILRYQQEREELQTQVFTLRNALEVYSDLNKYYDRYGHTEIDTDVATEALNATASHATHCYTGRDGECNWSECPQKRDYQKMCPLHTEDEEL